MVELRSEITQLPFWETTWSECDPVQVYGVVHSRHRLPYPPRDRVAASNLLYAHQDERRLNLQRKALPPSIRPSDSKEGVSNVLATSLVACQMHESARMRGTLVVRRNEDLATEYIICDWSERLVTWVSLDRGKVCIIVGHAMAQIAYGNLSIS